MLNAAEAAGAGGLANVEAPGAGGRTRVEAPMAMPKAAPLGSAAGTIGGGEPVPAAMASAASATAATERIRVVSSHMLSASIIDSGWPLNSR